MTVLEKLFKICGSGRAGQDNSHYLRPIPDLGKKSTAPFQIIFCVGAPRSGTTLLNGILAGGKAAYPMIPECEMMTSFITQYYNTLNFSKEENRTCYFGSPEKLLEIFKKPVYEVLLSAVECMKLPDSRKYLVLKHPELTLYLDTLDALFGDNCKIVCTIRDPRDTVASLINVYKRKNEAFVFSDIVALIFNYYYASHTSQMSSQTEKFTFVKYEDLAQGDVKTLDSLQNFVSYPIGRQGFREVTYKFNENDPFFSENYGKAFSTEAIGSFRKHLNEEQIQQIEEAFSGIMQRHGYVLQS